MSRKWIVVFGAVGVLLVFGLFRLLESEETRIRRALHGMEEGFNEAKARAVLEPLSGSYRDRSHKLGKDDLAQLLAYAFYTRRDSKTKKFLYRVELPSEELTVEVAEDGEKALVLARALFYDRPDPEAEPAWVIRIEANLVKEEEGWRIRTTEYERESGRIPF